MGPLLTFTAAAVERVEKLLVQAGGGVDGVRLGLRASGCAGHAYVMEYVRGGQAGDEVVETGGVRVFIAPEAFMFLVGMRVDWREDELASGFVFENPNEVDACGCGESVSLQAHSGGGG